MRVKSGLEWPGHEVFGPHYTKASDGGVGEAYADD